MGALAVLPLSCISSSKSTGHIYAYPSQKDLLTTAALVSVCILLNGNGGYDLATSQIMDRHNEVYLFLLIAKRIWLTSVNH